jgi:hypothetical protein
MQKTLAKMRGVKVVVNQFTAAVVDAGIKSFYISGTWDATAKTFTDVVGGGNDYLLFQANIDETQAASFATQATTEIVITGVQMLVLDDPVFV